MKLKQLVFTTLFANALLFSQESNLNDILFGQYENRNDLYERFNFVKEKLNKSDLNDLSGLLNIDHTDSTMNLVLNINTIPEVANQVKSVWKYDISCEIIPDVLFGDDDDPRNKYVMIKDNLDLEQIIKKYCNSEPNEKFKAIKKYLINQGRYIANNFISIPKKIIKDEYLIKQDEVKQE